MPKSEPPVIQHPLLRPLRWPDWVFVPLCSLAYTLFCFAFMMFAWGLRGASKPWWYLVARGLAIPGMLWSSLFYIPGVWWSSYIGVPLLGGIMGFGLIRLIRLNRRIRSHRPPSIPPRHP